MRPFSVRLVLQACVSAFVVTGATVSILSAQPVIDQFVSNAQVSMTKTCELLRINFNVRVRYTGHVPLLRGSDVRISLQRIDGDTVTEKRLARREGIRVDHASGTAVKSAELDLDQASGLVLQIQFVKPVEYQVVQSGVDSVTISIGKTAQGAKCKPNSGGLDESGKPDKSRGTLKVDLKSSKYTGGEAAGKASDEQLRSVEASLDEARDAIKKAKHSDAITILKKSLKVPVNKFTPEVIELIGVAHQKAGQATEARISYEDYLRRYKSGEGSERVRQRLEGLLTATGGAPEKLRGSFEIQGGDKKHPRNTETQWSLSGSLSTFYIRDDSYNTVKDISTAPNANADPDAHRFHQNTLLSNFDLFGSANNDQMKSKFKLSVTEERTFNSVNDAKYGVSSAFVDYTLKESDVSLRVGRQSRSTGGVIGRFDGAVAGWQANPEVRLNVVAGSPNWSRFDVPFIAGKSLYGASVDFGKVLGGLETSLFAIEQFDNSQVDRQAVGAEFRYFNKNKSALGTIDYDVHFQKLNAAIFSGSWTLEDKSVFTTAIDYRRVPYLASWNALQGQPFLTLYDMLKVNSANEVKQWAIDRTPTFASAMLSYSRPLNENLQFGGDATVTQLNGTVPSGGVDGTPASGTEYYLSTQLTATSLFTSGDMLMGAFRYASLSDSNVYVLDFNSRFPVTSDFRVSPRLRLGYRTGVGTDLKEITFLPTMLLNYSWTKDVNLELEVGTKWMNSELAGVQSTTKDLFVTLGVRKDFNIDGQSKCTGMVVSCAWSQPVVLSGKATNPVAKALWLFGPGYDFEGGLRYWYSSGRNRYQYYADGTTDLLVSQLNYTGLAAHSGEAFFRLDALNGPLKNAFIKGYVGGGAITAGHLYDEDFPPVVDPYSKTSSDTKGQIAYGSVDVGYNFFSLERFRAGAFIGYHHWMETVDARGCTQIGGNPWICAPALDSSLKVITEQDRWNSLRLGLSIGAKLTDRLRWDTDLAYVATAQSAQDTHYFTFGIDPAKGHGKGFQAETVLNYQVKDGFNLGIGFRWWRVNTNVIDSFNQLLTYQTDRYGVFVQGSYKLR